jgi:hypothetical protein
MQHSLSTRTEQLLPLFLALLSGLILSLSPSEWGPLWYFPSSFPLIVFCATWLGKQSNSKYTSLFTASTFLIPAIGYVIWKRQILLLDLNYIVAHQGASHTLRLTQHAAEGVAPLLLTGAVCAFFINRRIFWLILSFAIPAILCRILLRSAAIDLDHVSGVPSSQKILLSEILRIIPLLTGFIFINHTKHIEKVFISILTILGVWICSPLTAFYLWALPSGEPHFNPPKGKEQLGVACVAANPKSSNFHEQLNSQGTELLPGLGWWCNTNVRENWRKNSRATAALSLSKDSTLEDIKPYLPEILFRGVTRLAFIGLADENKSFFPLKKHLMHPASRWLLDPPPPQAHKGTIRNNELIWAPLPEAPIACAIWADWNTTIDTLFKVGTLLDEPNGPCAYKLFLILGEPNGPWNSPLPCSKRQ